MADAEGTRVLAGLPVAFVPNLGQWESAARYVARVGAMTVFLEEKGWTFTLGQKSAAKVTDKKNGNEHAAARGVAVRMTFVGAGTPELVAEDRLPGRHHYFLGNDSSKWRGDVPLYRAVRYREVHSGIDVRAREHDGHFEYDLLLQAGADLEPVEIAVEGIDSMQIDDEGALVLETCLGPVRMPAPLSWEEGPSGEKSLVACHYVLRGADRFGFDVAGRLQGWALVVDPGLEWSTFLGGTDVDEARAVALDAQGAATVTGWTNSTNFPTTPGATSYIGSVDVFVTRLSPNGSSLVYSTYLGGTGYDQANALVLDALGAAMVVGSTNSIDFPTTLGAFDRIPNGLNDAFVTQLSPTGASLGFSTFLGGTGEDSASALALDAQGAAIVAGATFSTDFPTTPGASDTSHNGSNDAFVAQLSLMGSSLVFSTFLGGTDYDEATAIAIDAQGAVTVAGRTPSIDFPTTPGAFMTAHNGGTDAFVSRLSSTGSTLAYSTFLGGTGDDSANALALDAQGAATVAGFTWSADFPTTPGAFDTTHNGGFADAFVAQLSPFGSSLGYSTFLGGTGNENANALCLDARGVPTIAGYTYSLDFPTTPGAFDTSHNGGSPDAFITRVSATGSSLVYSTFLGGTSDDRAYGLALDARGAATIAGRASSANFPTTTGAWDTIFNGGNSDAFVTRLDMLPTGVAAFGRSSPGCTGPLAISVTSMPQVGNAAFALTCGNAPPNAPGLILFTGSSFTNPWIVFGLEVWGDLSPWSVTGSASSNSIGASEVPLPIPNDPGLASVRLFAQFAWAGPNTPPSCPPLGFSASNALDFTIQP